VTTQDTLRYVRSLSLLAVSLVSFVTLQIGCSNVPPVTSKPLPSPVVSRQSEALDPALFEQAVGAREGDAYRVGPGDSLLVAIYGHPELALGNYAGTGIGRMAGLLIDTDGTIQLPLVGTVTVAGKTTDEVRALLETQLEQFMRDPKVTVQIVGYGSIRYYLLGQFTSPGLKTSDRPLRLLEAIALGGSVMMEKASLRSAYLARDGKRLPINFFSLIREGDLHQNIPLRSGDIVMVPDSGGDQAFVFGGVVSERTGVAAVPFINGRLDILQALAQAGFGYRERTQGVLSETRVIRSQGNRGELFVVDVEQILAGDAAAFHLAPGDIIFVPTTAWTDWNNTISQMLPTLQAISGLLNPFVQIRYLQQSN
jgi:polysaccharide export outer membrane protein